LSIFIRNLILVGLLYGCSSTTAFAEDEGEKVEETTLNCPLLDARRFSVSASLLGLYPLLIPGLDLDYRFDKTRMIEFTAMAGTLPSPNSELQVYAVRYKSFITEHFYYLVGLGISESKWNAYSPAFSADGHTQILESKSVVAEMGIGSRWNSDDHFFFEIDWFTFGHPIRTLRHPDPYYGSNAKDRPSFSARPEIALLRTKLGYQF
jgi:hypothetical protein